MIDAWRRNDFLAVPIERTLGLDRHNDFSRGPDLTCLLDDPEFLRLVAEDRAKRQ